MFERIGEGPCRLEDSANLLVAPSTLRDNRWSQNRAQKQFHQVSLGSWWNCLEECHTFAQMPDSFGECESPYRHLPGLLPVGDCRQGAACGSIVMSRSEEHTSELQSLRHLVCRLLL